MNDVCQGCYGGRSVRGAEPNSTQQCFRCHGSAREPREELAYVEALNQRVLARSQKVAA